MKIAYLGPSGSYTEEAAAQHFGSCELMPFDSIEDVFQAVASGRAQRGVVPIENIIQGPVTETQDGLYSHHQEVRIVDMLVTPIAHTLGSVGDATTIKRIYSKDQALKQCSEYLKEQYPHAELFEVDSTSGAMERLAEANDGRQAAIGSARAVEQYGLKLVANNIGNIRDNKTRFAVLASPAPENFKASGSDATAFAIYPPGDRVGILEEILGVISRDHGLSLSSIHSRPDRRGAFRFYMELEGHINDREVGDCIESLRLKLADDLAEILIFGSYPRCPFNSPQLNTIGLVGGTGKMGQWFERFFRSAGYEVLVHGRSTPLTLQQCIERSQAILINVPIPSAAEVARQVGEIVKPGQLVLDNTSIKTDVLDVLMNAVDDDVEVLGMHTIFGPNIDSLRKRNIVFTRTEKSAVLAKEFENIFYKHGAKITYANQTVHDQQMAFHQNLEHFSKLVLSKVLSEVVKDADDIISYSSPNSRASLHTMARVLDIDAALISEIQEHNKSGVAVIRAFVERAQEMLTLIEEKRFDQIEQQITKIKHDLGRELLDQLRQDD